LINLSSLVNSAQYDIMPLLPYTMEIVSWP